MLGDANVAAVAALVGDSTRATMLDVLMDGGAHPVGELARLAGVAASTASEHLARLRDGGLVVREVVGRESRYRLASAEAAEALEALARVAAPTSVRTLREANKGDALRLARTCYDHLAGRLGVGITEALVLRRALVLRDGSFEVTPVGERLLYEHGGDVAAARGRQRSFARSCLDWSERRPHLAGALGAALAEALVANCWLRRRMHDRGLIVTELGRTALRRELGVRLT